LYIRWGFHAREPTIKHVVEPPCRKEVAYRDNQIIPEATIVNGKLLLKRERERRERRERDRRERERER